MEHVLDGHAELQDLLQVTYEIVELAADMDAAVPEAAIDTTSFVDSDTAALIASRCANAKDVDACASGVIGTELAAPAPDTGSSSGAAAAAAVPPPPPPAEAGDGTPMDVVLSRLQTTVRSLPFVRWI